MVAIPPAGGPDAWTRLLADAVGPVPRGVLMAAGALVGGYLVGAVPVAWLLVRHAERRRQVERLPPSPFGAPPPPPRRYDRDRPGTLEVLAAGGVRVALLTVVLELLKGASVGLGARLFDDTPWFAATAIAGCVIGDAFPLGVRQGRRGIVPLISGVWAALPGTWAAGVLVAVPALIVLALGALAYEAVLAICVPLAFALGTHDLRTLPPAAAIVVALVASSRVRRLRRESAVAEWRRLRGMPPGREVEPPLGGPAARR